MSRTLNNINSALNQIDGAVKRARALVSQKVEHCNTDDKIDEALDTQTVADIQQDLIWALANASTHVNYPALKGGACKAVRRLG